MHYSSLFLFWNVLCQRWGKKQVLLLRSNNCFSDLWFVPLGWKEWGKGFSLVAWLVFQAGWFRHAPPAGTSSVSCKMNGTGSFICSIIHAGFVQLLPQGPQAPQCSNSSGVPCSFRVSAHIEERCIQLKHTYIAGTFSISFSFSPSNTSSSN